MVRPNRILEFGTFTGYATICLSEGLSPQGEIHTVEINDELESIHEKYFQEAGVCENITRHYGHALDVIKNVSYPHLQLQTTLRSDIHSSC